jgi:hypothetical protein
MKNRIIELKIINILNRRRLAQFVYFLFIKLFVIFHLIYLNNYFFFKINFNRLLL